MSSLAVLSRLDVPGRLLAVAEQLGKSPVPWPVPDGGERAYVKLFDDGVTEAWAIAWPAGGAIELHDHGRSAGAVLVVDGALHETYVRPGTKGLARRQLRQGRAVAMASGHVHDLVNAGTAVAYTIHVYSPPLRSMTFYEQSGDVVVPVSTEATTEPEVTAARRRSPGPVPRRRPTRHPRGRGRSRATPATSSAALA